MDFRRGELLRLFRPRATAVATGRPWLLALFVFAGVGLQACGGDGNDPTPTGPGAGLTIVQGAQSSLTIGQTLQLQAQGAQGTIDWSSSDPSVVTVTGGGLAVAQGPGQSTITARNQGRQAAITIDVTNQLPTANAGDDLTVNVNQQVTLDGTRSSDPDGQPLSYNWSFANRPAGSTATLANATFSTPSFTPDVGGDYDVQLIVNDGFDNSAPDIVRVTALISACTVTARTLSHGTVFVSSGFQNRSVTLQNAGNTTLNFNVALSGGSSGAFGIVSGGGAVALAPASSHTVTVRFQPTDAHPGGQSATIVTGGSVCGTVSALGTGGVAFTKVNQLMNTQSCFSCHFSGNVIGAPVLSHAFVSTRINTGNPGSSVFLTYPVGGAMFGGTVIAGWAPGTSTYNLVFAWIQQGGLNN